MNKKFLLLLMLLPTLPGCGGSRKCPVSRKPTTIVAPQYCEEIPCDEICPTEPKEEVKEYQAYEEDENWQSSDLQDDQDYTDYPDYNDEEDQISEDFYEEELKDQDIDTEEEAELDQDEFQDQDLEIEEESLDQDQEEDNRKEVLFELDGNKIKTNQDEILNSNLGKIKQLALTGHKIVIESQAENSENITDYLIENGIDKNSIEVFAKNDINELIRVSTYKEA